MEQTQILAQQNSFSTNAYSCGFPQYMAPQYFPQQTLPPIPTIPGFTPMFIGSPMLPPMQQSLPPMNSTNTPSIPMKDTLSEPTMPFFTVVSGSNSPPSQGFFVMNSPSPVPAMFVSPPPMMNSPQVQFGQSPCGLLQPNMPYASVSASRSLSPPADSDYNDVPYVRERLPSIGSSCGEKSKKELVDEALTELSNDFGLNFDTDGLRGQNILRIKVKTRVALENIVSFIRFCQQENLLERVSCPISTKKGRQHVRGFLAYLQTRNERDSDRVCELFDAYNAANNNPFKAYQRNPKSTLFKSSL